MKRYAVKEIFYSLQGEGVRAGTPNVFVRFAGCNLACNVAEHNFDCDTDFVGGTAYGLKDLEAEMRRVADPECDWAILTGGEPSLQVDVPLVRYLRQQGWHLAMETNGTRPLRYGLDWVCVSPKPGTEIRQLDADEVKVVLGPGDSLPDVRVKADHYLVSPAAVVAPCDHDGDCEPPTCSGFSTYVPRDAIAWCIKLCLDNPPWRLSVQLHKDWGVR